jgi:proteasome lid subunit RPN8/RPN11
VKRPSELILSRTAWQDACAHAIRATPGEVVGLFGGQDLAHGLDAYPLRNVGPQDGFLADPWTQFLAERQLRERGHVIAAIYHSHPDGTPTYSSADVRHARPLPYLIIATAHDRCEAAAYWLADDARPLRLRIV